MTARHGKGTARDMAERVVLTCSLVLQEAAHLGGADPDATSDRPLLRDADGRCYLAGTALKGVLRRAQARPTVFGDGSHQARLIVDDAPLLGAISTQVRDGISVDPELGIAAHQKRYDLELLSRGSRFDARFEAIVPTDGADAFRDELCGALERLTDGVEVGARTRRGFGRIRREGPWRVQRFAGPAGLRAWLAEGCDGSPSDWRRDPVEHQSLWHAFGLQPPAGPPAEAVEIRLDLRIVGSLLIRAAVAGSGPADHGHLHTPAADGGSEPVITGSSLAGALRARCRRIARTLLSRDAADDLVDELFGPRDVKSSTARASRLRVGEALVEGGRTLRHTRVRIDPWTGGARHALLFTSEPVYGGRARPVLLWTPPSSGKGAASRARAERALLLFALRDLAMGALHLGGESAGGRGRLGPAHDDGRFGWFGDVELRLTREHGLAGDFVDDIQALREWTHG